ncbi:MAG: hypothetical protein ABIN58_07040 [candidate division WOR-3 bacterium]
MIIVFDLEGPLSPMDHAAEAMRAIGKKLGKPFFFELFEMLSLYDDELTLEGKPGYNPRYTLRLIAPIVSTHLSDTELVEISKRAALTPGAKDLIASLNPNDVYVASTSYEQHAYTIAARLGIDATHVNCTKLPKFSNFPYLRQLLEIFYKYRETGMAGVKLDLDTLYWAEMNPDYLKTRVCGGQRKMDAVESIASERNVDLGDFIVVGDSITDIDMLQGVKDAGGLAISFNGNQYSVPKANLAVSALSLMALKPLIDAHPHVWDFVDGWNSSADRLSLLKPDTRAYFKEHKLNPYYDKIRGPALDEIIATQKGMRMALRKEYARLG